MSEIWTQHDIPVGEGAIFHLGVLRLLATRGVHDWSLAWLHLPEPGPPVMSVERPAGLEALGAGTPKRRTFAFPHSQGPLALFPALADRPVIVRPAYDITIAPQALVQLFVTTSLWVAVHAEGGAEPLMELPCTPPKETWFGPNTTTGERCYAGRLPLCHDTTGFVGMVHRAVTPLLIRNRSAEPLAVERFRVPVPRLTLFRAADGGFWTSRVSVVRREGADEVDVEVLPRAPDEAHKAVLVAPARDRGGPGVVSRALGSVFAHSLIP